jgi:predicted nuclease with TOPRIM domain
VSDELRKKIAGILGVAYGVTTRDWDTADAIMAEVRVAMEELQRDKEISLTNLRATEGDLSQVIEAVGLDPQEALIEEAAARCGELVKSAAELKALRAELAHHRKDTASWIVEFDKLRDYLSEHHPDVFGADWDESVVDTAIRALRAIEEPRSAKGGDPS